MALDPIETTRTFSNEAETRAFGKRLGALLAPGDVICLSGPLGAGKSTLARAIIVGALSNSIEAENMAMEIPSPTYTLVEIYQATAFSIHHFDLYRLENIEDVWELGLEDALEQDVCLIEWADRVAEILPTRSLIMGLTAHMESRQLTMRAHQSWRSRLSDSAL